MVLCFGAQRLTIIVELADKVRSIQLAVASHQATLQVLQHRRLMSFPLAAHGEHCMVEVCESALVVILSALRSAASREG